MNSKSKRKKRRDFEKRKNAQVGNPLVKQSSSSVVAGDTCDRSVAKRVAVIRKRFTIMEWCTIGGFLVAFAGLIFQFIQLHELSKSQSSTDKQVESLRQTFEKARELEIRPRLVVECPHDRVNLQQVGHFLKEAQVRLRNIGRGTAFQVIASVDYKHLKVGNEVMRDWKPDGHDRLITQRTIAAGDFIPFDEFALPLSNDTQPQGLIGTIGMYYVDEEGHETFQTQEFTFIVHWDEQMPHVHLEFRTPIVRTESFVLKEKGEVKKVRTVEDVMFILDRIFKEETQKHYTE